MFTMLLFIVKCEFIFWELNRKDSILTSVGLKVLLKKFKFKFKIMLSK
jgi:hypothetical protein